MRNEKCILIKTPKGVFAIPLKKVAEHRASFYEPKNSPEWQKEVDWVIKDHFEGIDWIENNTNWIDWESQAQQISDEWAAPNDFWSNSENFEIATVGLHSENL